MSRLSASRRRSRTARRIALAAALSLGLHALLLFVPPQRPAPAPPEEERPIELSLVTLPPPAEAAPDGAPARSPPVKPRTGRDARALAAAQPPPAPGAGAPERRAGDGVWRQGSGGLVLTPREPGAPPEAAGDPGPAGQPSEKERLEARVEGLFARDRAELRAREQRDAYWFDVEKRLRHGFEVEGEVVAGARGVPEGALGTVRDVFGPIADGLRDWAGEAAEYGRTGNPYGDGDVPGGDAGLAERLRLDASRVGELLPLGGKYRQALAALVLVEQDATGLVVNVELWRTSGSGSFDRTALAQARGLQNLPPPPEQGHASLWSFEAERSVTPPLPMVGCGFDATFTPTGCTWPLKENLRARVHLVAIFTPAELGKIRLGAP